MSTSNDSDRSPSLQLPTPGGSAAWREAVVAEITRVVTQKLCHQIPPRIRSVFAADDLAQETAIRVLDHADRQRDYSDISETYVLVVAKRSLIDFVRRHLAQKRSPASGFADVAPTSSQYLLNDIGHAGPTPSEVEIGAEFWATATSMLDDRDREFVELRYNEGLSDAEIGQLFDKSADSVRSIFFRIHKKLKHEFAERPEYASYF